jgi:hypothetical protein
MLGCKNIPLGWVSTFTYSLTLRTKGGSYHDLVVVGNQKMFSMMPIPNSIEAFVIDKCILFASYHRSG